MDTWEWKSSPSLLLIPEGESWMKKTIFHWAKTLSKTRFYRLEMPFLDKFMGFGHF